MLGAKLQPNNHKQNNIFQLNSNLSVPIVHKWNLETQFIVSGFEMYVCVMWIFLYLPNILLIHLFWITQYVISNADIRNINSFDYLFLYTKGLLIV